MAFSGARKFGERSYEFRQPKIEDFHPTLEREAHVFRFQVAMNQFSLMRRYEAFSKLGSEADDLGFRQRSLGDPAPQCLPGDIFHHEVIDVSFAVEVMYGRDIWMVQLGKRKSFVAKALARILIVEGACGKN